MVEEGFDVAPGTSPAMPTTATDPAGAFRQARLMQEQMRRRRN